METLSAPPAPPELAVSPSDVQADAPVAPAVEAHDAGREGVPHALPAKAARAKVEEPPLTLRELLEYVVMFFVGVLIVAVTLWFYWLIQ